MLTELRLAVRCLRAHPGFSLPAILTLALGIGIGTAVFSVVNGVLLQPLRFPEPDRIVSLNTKLDRRPAGFPKVTGGDFVDLRTTSDVFSAVGLYFGGEVGVQLRGRAEFTGVWWVTPEFFAVFGQHVPALSEDSAIVSEAFALRNFGDPTRAVGQPLRVENRSYRIAGALPGARFPADAEVWLPAPYVPENLNRTAYNYRAVARVKTGASLSVAQARLDNLAARLATAYPDSNRSKTFIAVPLREQLTGAVRSTLYVLLGAVLLVMLIACANVSNLLLARATVREKEIAVRAALGASRSRIIGMLFTESLTLAVAGGLLGIAFAWWGARLLIRLAPPNLPRVDDIHVDTAVLAFALALSALSAVAFGVLPAFHAARTGFAARGMIRGGSHPLRNSLVVAEIALSFVLAAGAGLFFRSFLALNAVDLGFKPQNILVMYAHAPARGLKEYVGVGRAFVDRLLPSLARVPRVQSTAAVMGLPAGRYGSNGSYAVIGKHVFAPGSKLPESNWALTSPNYFATIRIPLLRGRDFTSNDTYDAPGAIIVSDSVVRQIFRGEDPIGRQIVCGLDETSMRPMTIVGVVGDVRQDSPGAPPEPTLYMPLEQHPYQANELQVILRTTGSPTELAPTVRKIARDLNSEMAVRFTTLEDMVSDSIAAPRFRAFLATSFAALALLLAMAGIYAVMNYVVTLRTSEMGLRIALGAKTTDVMRLILFRAIALVAIGITLGGVLSLAVSRFVSALLFGLKPTDPSTYAGVLLGVAGIAILAAAGPALRAARVDPLAALREE
jgi:predicted permease